MNSNIIKLFSLKNKVVVITGGAVNLGYDMADVLAAAEADLVITSRDYSRATDSCKALSEKYAVETLGLSLDHTNAKQVKEVFSRICSWKNKIDILINNAGGGSSRGSTDFLHREPKDIDGLIQNNLNGMLYCSREVGSYMLHNNSGKIINIASIAGIIGRDRRLYENCDMEGQAIDYAAAKAGVIGATRDLAAYFGRYGICVNSISPGGFTGSSRGLDPKFIKEYADRVPLGRMGRDNIDIKGTILFLASSASDYITGQNIVLDGGFSIWN